MAKALSVLDPVFRIRFVIGTGMKDAQKVARGLVALKKNYETVEGADDLSIEYASADLALCAFGVTAYELAALGIPALYLGLNEDHVASASAFADAGMGLSLGLAGKVSEAEIARNVQWLLNKPNVRREMRNAGACRWWTGWVHRALRRIWLARWRRLARRSRPPYNPPAPARRLPPSRRPGAAPRSGRMAGRAHSRGPSRSSSGRKAISKCARPPPAARQATAVGALITSAQSRHQRRRAVQFVFLVDALRHDDLFAADRFQLGDLFGPRVILDRDKCRFGVAQECAP